MAYLKGLQAESREVATHIGDLMDAAGVIDFEFTDPGMFSSISRAADGVECKLRTGRVVAPYATFQTALQFLHISDVLENALMERTLARQAALN